MYGCVDARMFMCYICTCVNLAPCIQERSCKCVFGESKSICHAFLSVDRVQVLASATTQILQAIGEDPARQGLLRTPERFAKSLLFFTKGYDETLQGKCGERTGPQHENIPSI